MIDEQSKNNREKREKDNNSQKGYINYCYFCVDGEKEISYKDVAKLKRFLNERDMVISRQKTRLCAHHQRILSNSIKRARFLALLPVGGRKNLD